MENLKYLAVLVAGENWPILAMFFGGILVLAYKNCACSRTGRMLRRRGDGYFIFLASVAGFFHFADLMRLWIIGDLTIIEETALRSPAKADLLSMAIAALFGLAVGLLFYSAARYVMQRRSDFIERRYMLTHIRSLCRRQNDRYY